MEPCAITKLNNLCIEYDFTRPEYIVTSPKASIPKFQATCTVKKGNLDVWYL